MGDSAEGGATGRGAVGCLLAGLGAAVAPLVWAPQAAISISGGFESQARDLSVLFVDLPLVALGGALVPLLTWTMALRGARRPWCAAVAAVVALVLGVWGLTEWWAPSRPPGPGYGPGS